MILFDLVCSRSHVFEAWFRDGAAFEGQHKSRKILCPVCGEKRIQKAPMAPRIAKGARAEAPVKAVAPQAGASAEMIETLRKLREVVERDCDYVGPRFPEEARAIHYGERRKRGIYGEATSEEVESLGEEGIEVARIPWVPRHDS
ncbi:MAG: DUF1178 family protein [Rhodospirillales bacterium]|nr:DUF1178 family protein [Rhodospirillales bacterium]